MALYITDKTLSAKQLFYKAKFGFNAGGFNRENTVPRPQPVRYSVIKSDKIFVIALIIHLTHSGTGSRLQPGDGSLHSTRLDRRFEAAGTSKRNSRLLYKFLLHRVER